MARLIFFPRNPRETISFRSLIVIYIIDKPEI